MTDWRAWLECLFGAGILLVLAWIVATAPWPHR